MMEVLDPLSTLDREYVLRLAGRWFKKRGHVDIRKVREDITNKKALVHEICKDGEGLRRWRLHTQATHVLRDAPRMLRENFSCPATSQAFCKFLEILCRYPRLISGTGQPFRSFHLCEAPGHFITALDLFLIVFHPNANWYWEANSFNPHGESVPAANMILADDLVLLHSDRWRFGIDDSGDIHKWSNEYIQSLAGAGFDLVTADGSLYTQDDPGAQETTVLTLLKMEIKIATQILRDGGALVLKMYSMFTKETREMVQELANKFRDVCLFKPMCSKAGNSERYLICTGFYGNDVPPMKLPKPAEKVLKQCEQYFSNTQGASIQANLNSYQNISKEQLNILKDKVMHLYVQRILIGQISIRKRPSWLRPITGDYNPWKSCFGHNYVEMLKNVNTPEQARRTLTDKFREDAFALEAGEEDPMTIDVEYAPDETSWLGLSKPEALKQRTIVLAPHNPAMRHSLFTQAVLLHSVCQIKPEAVIDMCGNMNGDGEEYRRAISHGPSMILDASKMSGQAEWIKLLLELENNLEEMESFCIRWTAPTTPLILSRFSASIFFFLTLFFTKFYFTPKGPNGILMTFEVPGYREDMPRTTKTFLSSLVSNAKENNVRSFVPLRLFSIIHPYLMHFNKMQWRKLLPGIINTV